MKFKEIINIEYGIYKDYNDLILLDIIPLKYLKFDNRYNQELYNSLYNILNKLKRPIPIKITYNNQPNDLYYSSGTYNLLLNKNKINYKNNNIIHNFNIIEFFNKNPESLELLLCDI